MLSYYRYDRLQGEPWRQRDQRGSLWSVWSLDGRLWFDYQYASPNVKSPIADSGYIWTTQKPPPSRWYWWWWSPPGKYPRFECLGIRFDEHPAQVFMGGKPSQGHCYQLGIPWPLPMLMLMLFPLSRLKGN